jgi:type III secretion system FlhB-like substrate exporter
MSPHEKREDDRLAGLDPRWRAYRARARRPAPTASIAGATVLLLGDDAAVAIAWDAARRPIPTRVAAGRAARATQLLGLARRHRIPVHRDASLTAALASSDGPVPGSHWPRLAEIIAALRHP